MTIRKSGLKRLGLALAFVLAAALVIAGAALANQPYTVLTTPIHEDASIYMETNGDGLHQPEELVGIFDVYDGNKPITFSWTPYNFPEGVNGSYRISIWQNHTPLGEATWKETNVAHHWASNPNGTTFTYGPIGQQDGVCNGCPTRIVIDVETYELYQTENGSYGYRYTPMAQAYTHTNGGNPYEFVLETLIVYPEREEQSRGTTCKQGWSMYCASICPSFDVWCPDGQQATCEALFAAAQVLNFCENCGPNNNWCIEE